MSFTVLSHNNVRNLLLNLRKDSLLGIQQRLGQALVEYTRNVETSGAAARYQSPRTVVTLPEGQVTLFMPAISNTSIGAKILGVPSATKKSNADLSGSEPKRTAPRGGLLLLSSDGDPVGVVNAEELTAFRTALAALIPFYRRKSVGNIVVFGAGKQAIWHIRIALMLRGPEVNKITIINRSANRSEALTTELSNDNQTAWQSPVQISTLDPTFKDYNQQLEDVIGEADVIFCTTPSLKPLFPPHLLLGEGLKNSRLITAIGSYKPHMSELHSDIMRHAVTTNHGYPGEETTEGKILVDSNEGALEESGEIISAGILEEQLMEISQMLGIEAGNDIPRKDRLREWLANGFVIYKGVGSGIMDLAVAEALISLAREQNVGTFVSDF